MAIPGAKSIERVAVSSPAQVIKAKKAILKAFKNQVEGKGFLFGRGPFDMSYELGLSPVEALKWLEENMMPYYPLGCIP